MNGRRSQSDFLRQQSWKHNVEKMKKRTGRAIQHLPDPKSLVPDPRSGIVRFIRFFRHLSFKTIWRTVRAVGQQRLPGLAAEMAYNAMLSLFPAILSVLTAIGLFRPLKLTFEQLAGQLSEVTPSEASWLIQGFADAVSTTQAGSLFSFSFVFALWTASGALNAAMNALDHIHRIPRSQVRPFWKAKLVAIGLTIGAILLLLSALVLIFVGDIAVRNLAYHSGFLQWEVLRFWRLLTLPLVLVIMSLTFGFIYRYGPSHWNPGQPIMPGAILAAIFWAIISNLFRYYVRHFGNYNQVYGTVGAVIILMLWLYLSALVLLIGDQLNVTVGEAMQRASQSKQPRSERRE
jgi:membrane protein